MLRVQIFSHLDHDVRDKIWCAFLSLFDGQESWNGLELSLLLIQISWHNSVSVNPDDRVPP